MKKTIFIALTLILILASFISCENNTHEHTWDKGTVTKAATCTEKGVKTYTCTVCKETKTEDIAINPENHTWDEGVVTTAATCTEAGEETFKCTGCKETTTEPNDSPRPKGRGIRAFGSPSCIDFGSSAKI